MRQRGAVIYIRVSDEKQTKTDTDGGYSLPVQRQACLDAALEHGATFTEVFEEPGQSGTGRNRPALKAALARAEADEVAYFVVHKASRLARNVRDALNIEFELAQSGVRLVTATESWDASPMGNLLKVLQFGFDQVYSERLREDVRTKMEEKARRGGTPGIAPLGYLNVRKTVDGIANVARVEVDQTRAPHITWAFKTFAGGGYSVRSLAEALNDRGFTLRATRKLPERPVSKSTVATMLRNPYYIGIIRWGGKEYPADGSHQNLTDAATFAKVQQVLDGNNTGGDKSWRYRQYLKGTLFCGYCHRRLGFIWGRGEGGEYPYFYCLGRQQKNGCPQRYIPVAELEALVEDFYATVQDRINEHLPKLTAAFQALLQGYQAQAEAEAKRQKAIITKLKREQKKLLQLAYGDELPDDLVKDELRRITTEIAEAEKTREATAVDIGDLQARFDQFCSLTQNIRQTYRSASDEHRRALNQFLFTRIEVQDTEVTDHELAELPGFMLDDHLADEMGTQGKIFTRRADDAAWETFVTDCENKEPATRGVTGSNVQLLVDRTGLEPVTSRV